MLGSGTYHIYLGTGQIHLYENVTKSSRLFFSFVTNLRLVGNNIFIQVFIYVYIIFQEDIRSVSCDCLCGRSSLVVSESQHD